MKKAFLFLFLLTTLSAPFLELQAKDAFETLEAKAVKPFYPNFDDNPLFTKGMKEEIRPYLIPLDHPLKPLLDTLFVNFRALDNKDALISAGFQIFREQEASYVTLARHPLFPMMIFKLYLDSETRLKKGIAGWIWLKNRCDGARRIAQIIREKKMKHFAVPTKWLYPLPYYPTTTGPIQQPILLIEDDMQLVSHEKVKEAWKTKATKGVLKELYKILSHGYGSWFLTGNVPYSKSGKFVFIDTEYPYRKISMEKVADYLSPEMAEYWKKLLKKGG